MKRIQRQRTKGWRMPEGAVYVGRPSRWGNPYRPGDYFLGRTGPAEAVEAYRFWVRNKLESDLRYRDGLWFLKGRDLVCWCPLTYADGTIVPCHADVLLELANGEAGRLREPDGEAV